ncbi:MAG: UbiA family prenyltransferase [Lentisphaeria bacterium]|jgi:4-hydroxybenzoate polyprenyltransferase|nr:UbiA family prenyltransferase [Lentisphaeria bacterium]
MSHLSRPAGFLTQSRFVELLFAAGLPLIGYCLAVTSREALPHIWLMLIATGLAGAHILAFNDACFPRRRQTARLLGMHACILAPLFIFACGRGHHGAVLVLLAMIVNWDLYAWTGKRNWLLSLLHHCIGGALHVAAGFLFAGGDWWRATFVGVYFGLCMAGGAMHHEAIDVDEDQAAGFASGAVRFGFRRWFVLGGVPMTLAHLWLLQQIDRFAALMLSAFAVYIVLLAVCAVRGIDHRRAMVFRMFCRIVYGLAGAGYLGWRLVTL